VLNIDVERFALSRRCRHLRADLANGSIDDQGCLECPWHHARYDPHNGRMTVGPQGNFARARARGVLPHADEREAAQASRGDERDGDVFVRS
jgi:nitrite reductase/ring-hydroxylating ferredoxin subunit